MVMHFIKEAFQNTGEAVFKNVINSEKDNFNISIIEKSAILTLQFIASVICINIGLLFFNYKTNIKKTIRIVLKGFIALIITRIVIISVVAFSNLTFTTATIESIEDKLDITNYLNLDTISPYYILPLKTLNITHLFFVLILTYGVQELIKKNYLKSLLFTTKTYGIGVLLWCVFATIMEMNFN